MIKKFSALFFAVFYLLISIGFSVSVHHCSGMDEANETPLECGSVCCEIEKSVSDCCTHEDKVIQWEMDQQINTTFSFSELLEPIILDHITTILDMESSEEFTSNFIEDPPPDIKKPFLLFHQFTFYG